MTIRASFLVLLALLLSAARADAQTFRWIDDDGNPHYVGSLDQVPEQYRYQFEPAAEPSRNEVVPARGTSEAPRVAAGDECVLKVARTRTQPGSMRSFPNCDTCRRALEAMRGPDRGLADCTPLEATR
jgi:hypothetical protein